MKVIYLLPVLLLGACRPMPGDAALLNDGNSSFTVSLANRVYNEGQDRFELVYSVFDPNMTRRKMVACINTPAESCRFDCDGRSIFCGTYLGSKGGRSFFRILAELNEAIEVRANVYSESQFEQVTYQSLPAESWPHRFIRGQRY